jgi:hypothetical protein
MISRETKIPLTTENLSDIEDAEILDAIGMGLTDPDICMVLCVPAGRVTAMREVVEALDADAE